MPSKERRRTVREERRYRRDWKRVTVALSLFVALATTSALVLPAITMNQKTCELAEHQHTAECYDSSLMRICACSAQTLGVHQHESSCYDEAGALKCSLEDVIVHMHDANCYDEAGELVCSLFEAEEHIHDENCYQLMEADVGHAHSDACYTWGKGETLLCEKVETEGHVHTDECYEFVKSETLLCTLTEEGHAHTDECYEFVKSETLLCEETEIESHAHTDECYDSVKGDLICTEEERAATEANTVLVCEKEQIVVHTHGDSCYITEAEINENTEAWILELVHKQQEVEAETVVHDDLEAVSTVEVEEKKYLICAKPEIGKHQHEESCFETAEAVLICEIPEHTHTPDCEGYDLLVEKDQNGFSQEERTEISDVIALIDAFETLEVMEANLAVKSGEELLAYKEKIVAQINAALEMYNALSDKQKAFVTNYAILADYVYLVTDDVEVKDVIGYIGGLPTVKEFEEKYVTFSAIQKPIYIEDLFAQIDKINGLYENLSDEQKALILNYNKVTELEEHLKGMKKVEDAIEFVGEDYTTSVIAPPEANLPKDTVITARPLFDSNEMIAATFAAFAEPSEDNDSSYMEDILNAVTWGEVTRIKLFDITLLSDNDEVQPSAPVEVRTDFTEPLALGRNEVVYGVHIGENGVEILPANTERDENGDIVAITHTQTSFSPSGYILVHISNPTDKGPDILPVHYCLWINEQWIIVGSSRTGWYGDYTDKYDWTSDTRDYITLEQLGSVLGQYGLDVTDHQQVKDTIYYQRAEEEGITVRHDTVPVQKEINGQLEWVFLLSGNMIKDDGYHIYYVPANENLDYEKTYANNTELAQSLTNESKFYTMTVRDMNNIVYTVEEVNNTEVFPQTQIIRYGTPVSVTVRANIDEEGNSIGWQWVNDKGQVVHGITRWYDENHDGVFEDQEADSRFSYQVNSDGTETYGFVSILGRTTLIPYSRAVDGATQSTDKQVDIAVYLDNKWQKVGQLNLMYKQDGVCEDENGDPYWFVTAGQVYTILKDFGFHPELYSPDDEQDVGHLFTHAAGAFDENGMVMCANGVNTLLTNTVAIGFGHSHDGIDENNYTLFYLPGSVNEGYDNVHGVNSKTYGESSFIKGDRFYSVTIVDDYQLVYYGYETANFKVYVPEGESVTVKVQNSLSVLWSVRGHKNVEATQEGNFNVYSFTEVYAPIVIEASSLNPSFIVQYYANIERYQLFDSASAGTIPLINTAGKNLPTNSATLPLKYLQLTNEGMGTTDQNAGNATSLYKVVTYVDNAEIYKEKKFIYEKSHNWHNIDKLWQNDGYVIEAIWILKDGMDPESTDEEDWWIYKSETNGANITFTNLASEENAPKDENQSIQGDGEYKILITEGMVIRLHYYLNVSDYEDTKVKFFDYDISSNGINVGQQGINSIYKGLTNVANRYAFGNDNCFTGMGSAIWNSQKLNQYNSGVYSGCTFGLVTGINSDGNVKWADDVIAPNIFGSAGTSGVTGRTDYTGSLTFHRRGDVYTLSKSSVAGGSREELNYFFNPSPKEGIIYDGINNTYKTNIFTNNFWAMDGVPEADREDKFWGEYNGRGKVDGYAVGAAKNERGDSVSDEELPPSDDGNAHNWFFGMSFGISFNISEDYIGPLEYIFFGDDDMWVFLDDTLICDIGGVHSAVGEYVNLRDYLPVGGENTTGNHTLRFYYTERGASGSTCWMSFTLPSVTSTIDEIGTSEIKVQKTLTNPAGEDIQSEEEYEFIVNLYKDEEKDVIINTPFSVEIQRAGGAVDYFATTSGKSIYIGAGDTARILGVPIGTYYVIQETEDERFTIMANGKEGYVVEDYTEEGVNIASFNNILKGYELPSTGGSGTFLYIFGGIALMSIAGLICIKKQKLFLVK